ncbi:hypothetical protein Bhz55_00067 [Stenotrophomonas phage vB_SmaS_Bhz55]
MMDPRRIDTADNQANEQLALTALSAMPTFGAFQPMDFQRMLELMQEPVRAIDSCIGKDQLRKVCKQLFAQNLQLQTTVRNLQIEVQNSSQDFESAMDQLDKAIGKHTDFAGLEELMMKEAAEQDADAAQGQLDLGPEEASNAVAASGV